LKVVSTVCLAVAACAWAKAGVADLTAKQTQQSKAFVAGVHALDPHTEKSEPGFVALVEQYMPATGPAQTFLEFMAASGFECPWPPGAKVKPLTHHCAFKPDLGPTAEPSLSGVTERAWFGIIAHYNANHDLTKLEPYMVHGFVGP
jgi:hypothetical protein